MESKDPREIATHKTFSRLFPIKPILLEQITSDMKGRRYDESQPIICGTWEGQDEPVCIDGHTRLKAAIEAGIEEVPVFTHEFETEDEAIEHCIHLQRLRRNMTDAEILACIRVLDHRSKAGRPKRKLAQPCANFSENSSTDNGPQEPTPSCTKPRGKSADELADLLGTSTRKIEQGRTVIDHGGEETLAAVDEGKMSINKGYKRTQNRRQQKKARKRKDKSSRSTVTVSESQPDAEGPLLHREHPMDPDAELGAASLSTDQRDPVAPVQPESPEPDRTEEETSKAAPHNEYWVELSDYHYRALKVLGDVETRLAEAIELYLSTLGVQLVK